MRYWCLGWHHVSHMHLSLYHWADTVLTWTTFYPLMLAYTIKCHMCLALQVCIPHLPMLPLTNCVLALSTSIAMLLSGSPRLIKSLTNESLNGDVLLQPYISQWLPYPWWKHVGNTTLIAVSKVALLQTSHVHHLETAFLQWTQMTYIRLYVSVEVGISCLDEVYVDKTAPLTRSNMTLSVSTGLSCLMETHISVHKWPQTSLCPQVCTIYYTDSYIYHPGKGHLKYYIIS